jgi:hypothetical protein
VPPLPLPLLAAPPRNEGAARPESTSLVGTKTDELRAAMVVHVVALDNTDCIVESCLAQEFK